MYWQHTATEWTPIGGTANCFYGNFDGDGHKVGGIYIDNVNRYEGLFGYISGGSVKNLKVSESFIKGYQYVGGVAGSLYNCTVTDCNNTGAVRGIEKVGGVAGYYENSSDGVSVGNCYNTGAIAGCDFIGGLAGYIGNGTFDNCYNTGAINSMNYAGGISGYNEDMVNNCHNTGAVSGFTYVGGLTGMNNNEINDSYNAGAVHGDSYVGGVAGYNPYYIDDCYNVGSVTGTIEYTGGVAGESENEVSHCYNMGPVEGIRYTGGVAGFNYYSVSNCYNIGAVNGVNDTGGVVGDFDPSATVSACYYLAGTAAGGINGADIAGKAEALTDAQMKSQESFVGWDFTAVWEFGGSSAHYNYPTLKDVAQISLDPVTGVTLSDESVTLNIKGTKQLTATIAPDTAFNKDMTWSSSDSTVASVSSSGLVTALKTGKAVITVTTSDGNFTDTCTVIAVDEANEAEYNYTIYGDSVKITLYKGSGKSCVAVPSYLGGCPVTEIGNGCFANCMGIVRVYLPVTIIEIASDAFSGCTNLRYAYFMGNAPTVSGTLGSGSPIGTAVYYRSGTTGWTNNPWNGAATGIIPGDISGDGDFNLIDAVAFVQRLAQGGAALYTDEEFISADIVRDGAVNMIDIVKMVQALANSAIILY